jgi:alkylation response protein AidB-like acyl-CoA dehydrogenase
MVNYPKSLTADNQDVAYSSDRQQGLLDLSESYLRTSVAPMATEIDENPDALQQALQGLGDRSLLALRVPQAWGGPEVSETTYRHFQQLVTRYSGALAFLQTQHQSAAGFFCNSDNQPLKQQYLPYMSNGEVLVGIGFSHIRRQGDPMVKAIPQKCAGVRGSRGAGEQEFLSSITGARHSWDAPQEQGYYLEGQVPWVTGFGFFQDFIVGATLPDGRAVYGVVPFVETVQEDGGTITFSEPMELGAFVSTNTVTATLNRWFLPDKNVIFIKPAGAIHESDKKNVLHHGFFALGCARAGLDIVEATYQTKRFPFIQQAFESLNQELIECQSAMMQVSPADSKTWEEWLELRAWAIDLAQRCANAAVVVSSGAANYHSHAAQRVYKEALVFSVTGQTSSVMEATLARLVRLKE